MKLRADRPGQDAHPQAAAGRATPDVRSDMLQRIRQSLLDSKLTLDGAAAGGNPYDSRGGPEPGSVWGHRRR